MQCSDKKLRDRQLEVAQSAVKGLFLKIEQQLNQVPAGILAIGFCGGRSIVPICRAIVEQSSGLAECYWKKLQFFLVDERIVREGSSDLNYSQLEKMLFSPLLEKGLISVNQVQPLYENNIAPNVLISNYSQKLNLAGGKFFAAFFGVGEDGHLAALFPRSDFGEVSEKFIYLQNSPKPPAERISASAELVRQTSYPFLLFFGEAKQKAFNDFHHSQIDPMLSPCRLLYQNKNLEILSDLNCDD